MTRDELIEKMKAEGKTIGMNREDFQRWMEGLDTYRQGKYLLSGGKGYCCLGVEQHVRMGRVENATLPSSEYLERNGIVYLERYDDPMRSPYLSSRKESASGLNDRGTSFAELKPLLIEAAYLYDGTLEG